MTSPTTLPAWQQLATLAALPQPHLRERLARIMSDNTGQSIEQIHRDTDRDRFMSAEESVEYGLIDKVLTHRG